MHYYGTLGPACADVETLKKMFDAGMTGIRLNLSHGGLDSHGEWLGLLQEAAKQCGKKPQLLIDLQGPELRLGRVEQSFDAVEGSLLIFGDGGLPAPQMFLEYAEIGDHILLDDGKLEFLVESTKKEAPKDGNGGLVLSTRVLRGGTVKSGKSLAIVGKELPMPTLTEQDVCNIRLASRYGVTGVMLPFVRSREDLSTLRNALCEAGALEVEIFAKIENLRGVEVLSELLPHCDQVVIARGDLGNAMPLWKLPAVQKTIARQCVEASKPFMVVTQMLDSMHTQAVPTRAEVLDIYNAVLDGAASLMLTGETAVGSYPVEAIQYLVKTGQEAEAAGSCGQLR